MRRKRKAFLRLAWVSTAECLPGLTVKRCRCRAVVVEATRRPVHKLRSKDSSQIQVPHMTHHNHSALSSCSAPLGARHDMAWSVGHPLSQSRSVAYCGHGTAVCTP